MWRELDAARRAQPDGLQQRGRRRRGGPAARTCARRAAGRALVVGANIGKTKVTAGRGRRRRLRDERRAARALRRLPGGQRVLPEHPGPARPAVDRGAAPHPAGRRARPPTTRRAAAGRAPRPAAGQDRPGPRGRRRRRGRRPRARARARRGRRRQHDDRPRPRPRRPVRPAAARPRARRRRSAARSARPGRGRSSAWAASRRPTTRAPTWRAGADLVQGYTGIVYEGPFWASRINRALAPLDAARRRKVEARR